MTEEKKADKSRFVGSPNEMRITRPEDVPALLRQEQAENPDATIRVKRRRAPKKNK